MQRLLISGLKLAFAAAMISPSMSAQVRWDEARGSYWVTVRDEAGVAHEMRVEPSNRVLLSLILERADTNGSAVTYRYLVRVDSASPQPLMFVRIPCSASAQVQTLGDTKLASRREWGGHWYCTFYIGRGAGQSRPIRYTSTLLPGVEVPAVAVGAGGGRYWPTNDPTEETLSLIPLVDSLDGTSPNGLVKRLSVASPTFPIALVAATGSGLAIVEQQLTAICSQTDWIQPGPTCGDLAALLPSPVAALRAAGEQASAALTSAERRVIREGLRDFLAALNAGRDTTIHQNAFAVLSVLARTVRRGLPDN